jgi:hypothetical protein
LVVTVSAAFGLPVVLVVFGVLIKLSSDGFGLASFAIGWGDDDSVVKTIAVDTSSFVRGPFSGENAGCSFSNAVRSRFRSPAALGALAIGVTLGRIEALAQVSDFILESNFVASRDAFGVEKFSFFGFGGTTNCFFDATGWGFGDLNGTLPIFFS